MFNSLAEFIISPQFVWLWCLVILVYGLRWFVVLQKESLAIKGTLKKGMSLLEQYSGRKEFSENFESIHRGLSGLNRLKRPWKEYCQSLLISRTQGDAGKESIEKVRATRDSYEFFTRDSMVQPYIDQRHMAVIPTHLSSMGILGTFCGLSSGIFLARHGLAGGEMSEIQHGLSQLLSGASLAFWTSITGILSSVLFSRIEKKTNKSIEMKISDFNSLLQDRCEHMSLEQLGTQQIRQNTAQITGLEKVNATLLEFSSKKAEINEKILQDIVGSFRQTLTAACGQEIKYIAEAFRHIHLSLKETKTSLNDSGTMMLSTVKESSNIFRKNLHEISHQFQSSFHQTQDMIQKTFQNSITETQVALKKSLGNLEESVKQPATELGKTLGLLSKQIDISSRQWEQATEKNIQYSKKVMEAQARLSEYIEPLIRASHSISGACEKAQESLSQSSDAANKISQSMKSMEGINRQTQASWEQYCKRFEGVDQSLHQAFTHSQNNLTQYSEKIRSFTLELDKYMSKGILTLSGAVGDLHQAIGALPETLRQIKKVPTENLNPGKAQYPNPELKV